MVGLAGKEEEGEKDEVEEGFHVEEGNLRGCERMGEDMRGLKRMGEEGGKRGVSRWRSTGRWQCQ